MVRCLLVGCFASLLPAFACGEELPLLPLVIAETPIPQNPLSLPVLQSADGDDGDSRHDIPKQVSKVDLGTDSSDPSFTKRDQWVGDLRSIRNIRFVAPRSADQSSAVREPRLTSMHSTVRWVSPRAVHRTLYFNDTPLERDGKTVNSKLQPAISSVRFATDALTFPIKRITDMRRKAQFHYSTSPR